MQARAVGRMRLVGAGVKSGLGFGSVVAALHAVVTVAEPRASTIPRQKACSLSTISNSSPILAVYFMCFQVFLFSKFETVPVLTLNILASSGIE